MEGRASPRKPRAADPLQISFCAEFAGGVTFQGEEDVVLVHSLAIVTDPDATDPVAFHPDFHTGSASVNTVFQQFFHH